MRTPHVAQSTRGAETGEGDDEGDDRVAGSSGLHEEDDFTAKMRAQGVAQRLKHGSMPAKASPSKHP
jgi:hypothetical protein